MKSKIKKFIPAFLINYYHFMLAFLGALIYDFPSKKIKVIGVTGTKGKSSVVYLAGKILEESGEKVGWVSSLSIKVGDREVLNHLHLTMPGRFFIQKMLRAMVDKKCNYALIEVTSEGIKQHRHRFIDFNTAVFTNLSEEHLEAHGGFENYKIAKSRLFEALNDKDSIIIANLDDPHADYFLNFKSQKKIGFGLNPNIQYQTLMLGKNCAVTPEGVSFTVNDVNFDLKLLGRFNIYNALAAISIAFSEGFNLEYAKKALEKIKNIEGRMEEIKNDKNFRVFVDLAHTPDSFRQVFELTGEIPHQRIIAVFGAAGGGRDKWKRPKLGQIAAAHADYIILTNEDPYDEDAQKIVEDIAAGIKDKKFKIVLDRRAAIYEALKMAQQNDIVLVLGKGTEATLVIKDKKINWDDRAVTKEELGRI
jgi:UDP-N-acetylmuramoyl-L-alanyl-D-glutamate--2,6-diaminopimelate ligase